MLTGYILRGAEMNTECSGKVPDGQSPFQHLKSVYCESGAGTTPKVVFLFADLDAAQSFHKWALQACLAANPEGKHPYDAAMDIFDEDPALRQKP
jgi:hypothetical protein